MSDAEREAGMRPGRVRSQSRRDGSRTAATVSRPGRSRGRSRAGSSRTVPLPLLPSQRAGQPSAEGSLLIAERPLDQDPPWLLDAGTTRADRLGRRREQQAARRRRVLVVAAALLVVALVLLALQLLRGGGPPPVAAADGRTQRTLLLQVRGADGAAEASVLMATDPEADGGRDGELLLIPGDVLTAVPSNGTIPFRRALSLPDADASRTAVEDVAKVVVDSAAVLDEAGLAALVDQLGGITADVDSDVVQAQPDGSGRVVLAAGPAQLLTGTQVVQLLRWSAPGEQSLARLPRTQHVLQGLLAKLPTSSADVGALLTGLGPQVTSSRPVAQLASFLTGIAAATAADRAGVDVLPVTPVDTGASAVVYRVDTAALETVVANRFAHSRPASAADGTTSVFVLNGIGTPGLGAAARTRLGAADLAFVGSSNAGSLDHTTSVVIVRDATPASIAAGHAVAKALGLPAGAVRVGAVGQTIADVLVVLGADFKG